MTKKYLLPCLLLPVMAACSEPTASDEDLADLLADNSRTEGAPRYILDNVVDCVRLIGGLDDVVYRDHPAELLGLMKTECRMKLQKRLDDPERNKTALTLEVFEGKEVAERVVVLSKQLSEVSDAFWEEERARREAAEEKERQERFAALEVELAERKAAVRAYWAPETLKAAFEELAPLCSEWSALRDSLPRRKYRRWRVAPPPICGEKGQAATLEAAQTYLVEIGAVEVKKREWCRGCGPKYDWPDTFIIGSAFVRAEEDLLNAIRTELTNEIAEMRATLAGEGG